jgi:hypothetical protein
MTDPSLDSIADQLGRLSLLKVSDFKGGWQWQCTLTTYHDGQRGVVQVTSPTPEQAIDAAVVKVSKATGKP